MRRAPHKHELLCSHTARRAPCRVIQLPAQLGVQLQHHAPGTLARMRQEGGVLDMAPLGMDAHNRPLNTKEATVWKAWLLQACG